MAEKTYKDWLEIITAELCRAAVQQHGWALEDVPKALQEQVKQGAGIKD